MLGAYGSTKRYKSIQRLTKVNDACVVGAGGELSDYQQIVKMLDELATEDFCMDDGHRMTPSEVFSYLTRVMYNRRNKFDPLWNSIVVGGLQRGKPFLGTVGMIGTNYTDDTVATGFGNHLARPLMRERHSPDMDEKAAMELLHDCLRVCYYRDKVSVNKFQISKITKDGVDISEPFSLDTKWDYALFKDPTAKAGKGQSHRKGICSSDRCRDGWGVAAKGYGVLGEFHGWESHGFGRQAWALHYIAEHGPKTGKEIAAGLSLNERYIEEWLRHQAANKIISTDEKAETYWLSEYQKDVLVRDETSPFYAIGALIWQRHFLVKSLKSVPDVAEKLENGCMAADVGCGYGFAVNLLAEAFPKSQVHGYDIADISLEGGGMKKDTYDFVLSQDAVHDMSQPFEVMENVCKAMKEGGIWVIGDMKCLETHGENVHKNPLAPMVYGFSCHVCLPSAMQGPHPAALGAMGLTESLLREKLLKAGFKSLEKLEFGHKMNQFWLVRK
eukprot:jgi/Picre1/32438/NNA_007784.t1